MCLAIRFFFIFSFYSVLVGQDSVDLITSTVSQKAMDLVSALRETTGFSVDPNAVTQLADEIESQIEAYPLDLKKEDEIEQDPSVQAAWGVDLGGNLFFQSSAQALEGLNLKLEGTRSVTKVRVGEKEEKDSHL